MASVERVECPGCGKALPLANFALHELRCQRPPSPGPPELNPNTSFSVCPRCGVDVPLSDLARHQIRCTPPMKQPGSALVVKSTVPSSSSTAACAPDSSNSWACGRCSFQNAPEALDCCQMCLSVRVSTAALPAPPPAPPPTHSSDCTPKLPPMDGEPNLGPPWNRRVAHDKDLLGVMHEAAPWIPAEHQIRPSPETLERKAREMASVTAFYTTVSDFVWDVVFELPTRMDAATGKLVRQHHAPLLASDGAGNAGSAAVRKKVFAPNQFPYSLDPGSNHAVM